MINAVGREIPDFIEGYGRVRPFAGAAVEIKEIRRVPVIVTPFRPGSGKTFGSIGEAIGACDLRNGMTISFHHCLRNGDHVLNRVLEAVAEAGLRDPAFPIEISQEFVDYIVPVESIGDKQGIVSGTTRLTDDPVGLKIAAMAAGVIEASGLLKDGFSFQTGAGGISLAVAACIRERMKKNGIRGSFVSGGITAHTVEMLEEGLFQTLFDAQCFDLTAVESFRKNSRHQGMSIGMYGNPHNKGAVVNNLDVMILGAAEIDKNFNVNVTTGSNGILMGGSGGHADTAAGARLALVVTKLTRKQYPCVVDRVTTVTTPGETIDVLVTEGGIAVNPRRCDLAARLRGAGLPVVTVEDLKEMAEKITGIPEQPSFEERIVAVVEYRDGTVIDLVRQVNPAACD